MEARDYIAFIQEELNQKARLMRQIDDEMYELENMRSPHIHTGGIDETGKLVIRITDEDGEKTIELNSSEIYKYCVKHDVEPGNAIKDIIKQGITGVIPENEN